MIRKHSTRLSQLNDDEPEDEQEQQHRTAAHDYPEMGSILSDRPDPGSQITVIGSKTAAAYGTEEDPRNGGYNGGEGDTGMDWAEPAEQDWTEEHLGPQQEAPPPPWMTSPVMARLAEMEEAAGLVGMRHHATAISVTGSSAEYLALKRHLVEDHGKEIFDRANHRDPSWQFTMAHAHDQLHDSGDADHQHEGELDPLWEHGDDASGQYLGSRRHATDINGTNIDGHGDAPQHGTVPRAGDPDSYDDRSTEGDGDPRWNQALPKSQHGDKKNENAATVGMYPEGMSAGGGPGLEIGAFTAALDNLPRHMEEEHGFPPQTPGMSDAQRRMLSEDHDAQHAYGDVGHGHPDEYDFDPHWDLGDDASSSHQFTGARVPWTGPQREHLHSWQTVPPGITEGDFVPSGEFLGRNTPPRSQVEERMKEAQGEGIGPVEASADSQWEDHMRDGHGWGETQFNRIRAHGDRIQDLHQGMHDAGMANHSHTEPEDEQGPDREESLSNMFGPSIFSTPRMRTPEGYPIVAPEHGGSSKDPARAMDRLRRVKPAPDPAVYQQTDPARFRRMMSALNVHVHVHDHNHGSEDDSPAPAHEHDDPGNDLDGDEDGDEDEAGPGNDSPQAIGDGEEDNPADIPPAGIPGNPDDMPPADPDEWPAAGAEVSERNRAWTQGRDDGKVKRGTPPAAPFAPDDGDSGGGGDQDDDNDQSAGTDPNDTGKGDEDTPFSKDAALAMFTAAAGNRDFRFEFTAAWSDVVAKAKRIRAEGYVRITHASAGMVIGEVRGDHDTYESGIQRPVGKRQTISHWACGCPWASFHQKTASSRYAGRPCSHVMALQFEAQSRGMFGRSFDSDAEPASWSPSSVVVKSMPPYDGAPHRGRWSEEWRAPLARRSSMVHRATPDEARDWDWTPEERDEWEIARGAPSHRATTALVRAKEDPDEIGALRLLAGMCSVADLARSTGLMARHLQVAHGLPEDSVARRTGSLESADAFHQALHDNGAAVRLPHRHEEPGDPVPLRAVESFAVTADQANSSWGSQNVSEHPTQKPYGATSPPNKDQSPASYGFLAAPDPENWGGIQDGSALQMPLSNTAAQQPVPGDVHWPSTEGWQQENQDSFGYSDRANTAGPSTAISPRDPNGIRMEESRAELKDHPEAALPETTGEDIEATAAADGTIGGGDAGTGQGQGAPLDTAALGEFGASFQRGAGTPMGDLNRETSPQAQQPSPVTQEPGMGAQDEYLSPEDPSIQTTGNQQWSGGGADSDEVDVPAGLPQGGIEDIVASFQRSAASRSYTGDSAPGQGDGDIAVAAREYLAKTADVLPQAEADDLIREGRGQRARNLDLLRLEGTHYEDADSELERRGLNLDNYDDDVMFA
jgi:hypothetical protein